MILRRYKAKLTMVALGEIVTIIPDGRIHLEDIKIILWDEFDLKGNIKLEIVSSQARDPDGR
jgi:hypothetical protein